MMLNGILFLNLLSLQSVNHIFISQTVLNLLYHENLILQAKFHRLQPDFSLEPYNAYVLFFYIIVYHHDSCHLKISQAFKIRHNLL